LHHLIETSIFLLLFSLVELASLPLNKSFSKVYKWFHHKTVLSHLFQNISEKEKDKVSCPIRRYAESFYSKYSPFILGPSSALSPASPKFPTLLEHRNPTQANQ